MSASRGQIFARAAISPSTLKASLDVNGALKDTAANRALNPQETSHELFQSKEVRAGAHYRDDQSIIFCDDVETRLKELIDTGLKVDCIVTSPPYYGQRDYGFDGQIGLEPHPSIYIERLVDIFSLCFDLLKDTGSLWINIGDTYWSGKGAAKGVDLKQGARRFGPRPQDGPGDGRWARPKQLLLLPHRLAIALQDEGWLIRNDNVWVKPNPLPDQVRDRCSVSHEYVFHLTKSRWYYFNRQAVGRPTAGGGVVPPPDTWFVNTSSGNGSHRASFSDDLVRIPILATTPNRGIVLDPFNGSGTSMVVARKHNFRSIGIDMSWDYCDLAVANLNSVEVKASKEVR